MKNLTGYAFAKKHKLPISTVYKAIEDKILPIDLNNKIKVGLPVVSRWLEFQKNKKEFQK